MTDPSCLRTVATAQARAGDVPTALQTAATIETANSRAIALGDIAAERARTGDVEGSRCVPARRDVAERARTGDVEGSRQSFEAASNTAGTDAAALRSIAAAQGRAGDVAAALRTAQRITGDSQDVTLRWIAAAQEKAGDTSEAYQTALSISDNSLKADFLLDLVFEHLKAGNYHAADSQFSSLASGETRCEGYLAAAEALLADPSETDALKTRREPARKR